MIHWKASYIDRVEGFLQRYIGRLPIEIQWKASYRDTVELELGWDELE